jgi:general secretion pathway protein N
MKSRIFIVLSALLLLIVLIIAKLPAKHVIYRINFPNGMGLYEVSGTIWQGSAASALVHRQTLNNVTWDISVWALLSATVSAEIHTNQRASTHLNGTVEYGLLSKTLDMQQLKATLPAEVIFAQAALPVPVIGAGKISITLIDARFDVSQSMPVCEQLAGAGSWQNAGVLVSTGMVDLGEFNAQLRCVDSLYNIEVKEPNKLGLSFIATGANPQQLRINGRFKLPPELPEEMQRVGEFLGQPDAQGYTPLKW